MTDGMKAFKIKVADWVWYSVGMKLWMWSARNHPQEEVKRRLGWMTLDCKENSR